MAGCRCRHVRPAHPSHGCLTGSGLAHHRTSSAQGWAVDQQAWPPDSEAGCIGVLDVVKRLSRLLRSGRRRSWNVPWASENQDAVSGQARHAAIRISPSRRDHLQEGNAHRLLTVNARDFNRSNLQSATVPVIPALPRTRHSGQAERSTRVRLPRTHSRRSARPMRRRPAHAA